MGVPVAGWLGVSEEEALALLRDAAGGDLPEPAPGEPDDEEVPS